MHAAQPCLTAAADECARVACMPVCRLQVDMHLFTRLTNPVTGILGA